MIKSLSISKTCNISLRKTGKVNLPLLIVFLFGITVIGVAVGLFVLPASGDGGAGFFASGLNDNQDSKDNLDRVKGDLDPESAKGEEKKEKLTASKSGAITRAANSFEPIQGSVLYKDGSPAANAKLRAIQTRTLSKSLHPKNYKTFEAISQADGTFIFNKLPIGNYSIMAAKDGMTGAISADALSEPYGKKYLSEKYEIFLSIAGSISGKVVDPEGQPVPNAHVIPSESKACYCLTDSEGRFSLNSLKLGFYRIAISSENWGPTTKERVLTGTSDLEIKLYSPAFIKGSVSLDGAPVANVLISSRDGGGIETLSLKDGTYILGPLGSGYHSLSVVGAKLCASTNHQRIQLSVGECLEDVNFALKSTGMLKGKVTDKETSAGLEGVWLSVKQIGDIRYSIPNESLSVRTDSNGIFNFASLAPTKHSVFISSAGPYIPITLERDPTIKSGDTVEGIEFELEMGAVATVKVSEKKSGAPVSGASIILTSKDNQNFRYLQTSAAPLPKAFETEAGLYTFQGLRPGVFTVKAQRHGFASESELLVIDEEKSQSSIDIALPPTLSAKGKVKNTDGAGIPNACVSIRNNNDFTCFTDENGAFEIKNIRKGNSSFYVEAKGYAKKSKNHNLNESKDDIEFTLHPEGDNFFSGRLTDDNNAPLANVMIYVYQYGNSIDVDRTTISKEDGSFSFENLIDAPVDIDVDSSFGYVSQNCYDLPINTVDHSIVLKRLGRIQGRVIDADGNEAPEFYATSDSVGSRTKDSHLQARLRNKTGVYGQEFTNGVFDLKGVYPTKVAVFITTKDGVRGVSNCITVTPGETIKNVTIKLKETGSVAGLVIDKITQAPIANAKVICSTRKSYYYYYKPSAVTDENGAFLVENMLPGPVWISAVHKDYSPCEMVEASVIKKQKNSGIKLRLEHGGTITGRVIVNGQGKAGVNITASLTGKNRRIYSSYRSRRYVSGLDGLYRINNLPPGTYNIQASVSDKKKSSSLKKTIDVPDKNSTVQCDIIFASGGVTGLVTLFGEPRSNVRVQIYAITSKDVQKRAGGSGSTQSDKTGLYTLNNIAPGKYRITARYYSDGVNFRINKEITILGAMAICDIAIGDGQYSSITGYLYKNSIPVVDGSVRCYGSGFNIRKTTDSTGFFQFPTVLPGKVELTTSYTPEDNNGSNSANPDSYSECYISITLNLDPGVSVQRDIHMSSGNGVISGKITQNGKPPTYSVIEIEKVAESSSDQQFSLYKEIDKEGRYYISALADGVYNVKLTEPRNLSKNVKIINNCKVEANFAFDAGKTKLYGAITNLDTKKKPRDNYKVFVVKPGACNWKTGDPFNINIIGGNNLIAIDDSISSKGKFSFWNLFAETVDVVAIAIDNNKITKIDIKQVILYSDIKNEINLQPK